MKLIFGDTFICINTYLEFELESYSFGLLGEKYSKTESYWYWSAREIAKTGNEREIHEFKNSNDYLKQLSQTVSNNLKQSQTTSRWSPRYNLKQSQDGPKGTIWISENWNNLKQSQGGLHGANGKRLGQDKLLPDGKGTKLEQLLAHFVHFLHARTEKWGLLCIQWQTLIYD
jgi:hypothetical protein